MITVLFGAGASYGSDSSGTPPLGPDLYDALRCFAPLSWGSMASDIQGVFRRDFESGMRLLLDSSDFAAPLQWDMAEYFYTQFSIGPTNLYVKLLREIRESSSNIVLSSINYDTLLFQAAQRLDIALSIGSSRSSDNSLAVTLPHGSCALYCSSLRATGGVRLRGRIASCGVVKLFGNPQEFYREKATNAFPPVMSYFEPAKFTPSGASFIREQRRLFADHVTNSERVLIIGVGVRSDDEHLWAPLQRTSGKIMYAGGPLGKQGFDAWAHASSRTEDLALDAYFDSCLDRAISFLVKT